MDKENDYIYYYGYFSKKLQSSRIPEDNERELQFNMLKKAKPFIKKVPFLSEFIKKSIEEFNRIQSKKKKIDIYYEPNYIPTEIRSRRLVTTIHDFSFYHHPEWHPRDRVNHFKRHFYSRIGRSDLITTDSKFIKQEAQEILKIPSDKIIVVPMGYDTELFKPLPQKEVSDFCRKKGLPEKFILFVGSIEPRKNIIQLLSAYLLLPKAVRQEYRLVLVGFRGWENKDIMKLIHELKEDVVFLGYLNVLELALIYNAATIFAYPSLYEGFGLPPLEAMACGTPVLVSNVASLPEVCGDAAVYCNPLEKEDIAEKLHKMLEGQGMKSGMEKSRQTQIGKYTWEKSAEKMIDVFKRVM